MPPPETRNDHHRDDLDWLAFGYATGDLDAGASAAFERRLDTDQSAREALAEAVGLAGAVVLAAKADHRFRLRRRRVAALMLTAAALALISAPRLFAPVRVEGTNPGAVALAWSGLRQQAEPGDPSDVDDLIDRPNEQLTGEPADSPPRWLLEAVSLPAFDNDNGRGT